ncbi:ABC transporter substrate-binding protein [Nocardia higoensis]|uniref:ABC transporter substrate-binding protein n=1 Tax=Nocardia higoensis TaxID=228599 RepID=A0ABS0D5L3_9NOCA|nr:ABC transporter substrate-binding protein [Nocardia higoensis]MBF6353770.1 ABC transporter substrate-binding protein [Nocardia higoensis]
MKSLFGRRIRRLAALPATLVVAVGMTACGETSTESAQPATGGGFPLTISSCGREVTFDAPPQRVVTVGSIAAPMIAAAGAGDRVVARTFETAPFPGKYADQLAHAEFVAPTAELAREEIIARTPDVVVSFEGAAVTADDLAAAQIPLVVTRGYCQNAAGSFDDIFDDIELYGKLFGTEPAAAAEVEALRARVASVTDKTSAATSAEPRPAAALILSRDGSTLNAYGGTSTVDTQMQMLGLSNIFGDVDKRSFGANTETLIQRDPAVVILLTQGDQTPESARQALRSRPELADVEAIRADRIIAIPFGYTGPGPVAVEGLEVLANELADLR